MSYLEFVKRKEKELGLDRKAEPVKPIDHPCDKPEPVFLSKPLRGPLEAPPIRPGWVVAYRGRSGLIEGSAVVSAISGGDCGWTFTLSNGIKLHDTEILSVGAVENGRWLGAWTVRDWGLDGKKLFKEGGLF